MVYVEGCLTHIKFVAVLHSVKNFQPQQCIKHTQQTTPTKQNESSYNVLLTWEELLSITMKIHQILVTKIINGNMLNHHYILQVLSRSCNITIITSIIISLHLHTATMLLNNSRYLVHLHNMYGIKKHI